MHVCVFSIYKTDKKVVKLFSLVHISFSKNLVYLAYAEFLFFKQIVRDYSALIDFRLIFCDK